MPGQLPDPQALSPSPARDASRSSEALVRARAGELRVVSLLDQMGSRSSMAAGRSCARQRNTGDRLTVTEDEVRGLIAMGTRMPPRRSGDARRQSVHIRRSPCGRGAASRRRPRIELADMYAACVRRARTRRSAASRTATSVRPYVADQGPLGALRRRVRRWRRVTADATSFRAAGLALAPGTGWGVADPSLPDLRSPDPRFSAGRLRPHAATLDARVAASRSTRSRLVAYRMKGTADRARR